MSVYVTVAMITQWACDTFAHCWIEMDTFKISIQADLVNTLGVCSLDPCCTFPIHYFVISFICWNITTIYCTFENQPVWAGQLWKADMQTISSVPVRYHQEERMCCTFHLYLPMTKSHLTQYLSKVTDCVSPGQVKWPDQEKNIPAHKTAPLFLYEPIKLATYSFHHDTHLG